MLRHFYVSCIFYGVTKSMSLVVRSKALTPCLAQFMRLPLGSLHYLINYKHCRYYCWRHTMNKLKTVALSGAILVFGVVAFVGLSAQDEPDVVEPQQQLPVVSAITVQEVEAPITLTTRGRVEPLYHTQLAAEVSGRIEEVAAEFNNGDLVSNQGALLSIEQHSYHAALLKAKAVLSRAQAEYTLIEAQAKVAEKEWRGVTDQTPSDLALYKPQLARELANIEAAKADLLIAQRDLNKTVIRAPFNAVVATRSVGLGQYVEQGDVLGQLMSTDIAQIRLPLSVAQLKRAPSLIGKRVELTSSLSKKRYGEIVRIENTTGEHAVNHVVVRVMDPLALHSDQGALRFGDYVIAKIELEQSVRHTAIPARFLRQGSAWVVDGEDRLHQRQLTVKNFYEDQALISAGLEAGDRLIVTPLQNPVAGMQVEVRQISPVDQWVQTATPNKEMQ
ncbi:hypothetical protein B1L02_23400 [Pseudoalteromonas piscicida]|uniref:Efflux RND transporter periplasmic adaptor subunit n=2 Tax=Pseudoalteromonas piscicida TaxID=43662 RepID=A0AAD0RNV4_PSEO7|nr:hypothetical protein B1L02_23400 [Pseudoalteromonas piscicida]AXR00408.1 efflux RND transporter periplasmic adaptor subunit [Pseudoalteromonas piscicida]AXR04721.1 efflux RND transporter periplasmic adaptor subunit [Pseudoalteromonas piscicida]